MIRLPDDPVDAMDVLAKWLVLSMAIGIVLGLLIPLIIW